MSNPYPQGQYSEPQDPFATNPVGQPAVPPSPAPRDPAPYDPRTYDPDPFAYGPPSDPSGSQVQPSPPAPRSGPPAPASGPPALRSGPSHLPVSVPPGGWAGIDPLSGAPLSPKSKIYAGLLQLLPGLLLGLGGLGRLYAGHTRVGVIQLTASLAGWISLACGFAIAVPWIISVAVWIWFIIDGIVMLAGRPLDGKGRVLRS